MKKEIIYKELPFWDRWSVGVCEICNEAHSLIDGLCYDCRAHPIFIPVPELRRVKRAQ